MNDIDTARDPGSSRRGCTRGEVTDDPRHDAFTAEFTRPAERPALPAAVELATAPRPQGRPR